MKCLFILALCFASQHLFVDALKNGNFVVITEHPYVAQYTFESSNGKQILCGAAILSQDYVITHKRCIKSSAKNVQVHVGSSVAFGGDVKKVAKVHLDEETSIALLKLETSLEFNQHVQPIGIDQQSTSSSKFQVLGYADRFGKANVLQAVETSSGEDKCPECEAFSVNNLNALNGDAGSLVVRNHKLVGLLTPGRPNGVTKVSNSVAFIEKVTQIKLSA